MFIFRHVINKKMWVESDGSSRKQAIDFCLFVASSSLHCVNDTELYAAMKVLLIGVSMFGFVQPNTAGRSSWRMHYIILLHSFHGSWSWRDGGRRAYSGFLEKQLILPLLRQPCLGSGWSAGTLSPFIKQKCSCWPEVQHHKRRFHRGAKRFISRADIISVVAFSLGELGVSRLFIKNLKL